MNHVPPVEPSSDQRPAAKQLRGMYLALLAEQFSESEALAIVGYVIAGNSSG